MDEQFFEECSGSITAASGFVAGGIFCGIRKVKKDLALIRSLSPAVTAAVFTCNKTQAAPILVDKQQLANNHLCSAIVVNSGNANACTGERGLRDAWEMVATTARALDVPQEHVLVSSTGVIGQYLPMEKIIAGIFELAPQLSATGNRDAAEAIMTTDTFPKEIAIQYTEGTSTITIGGIAKGSGMIAPNMATMLAFITTDAVITPEALRTALTYANNRSFNRLTVDGDTSTNDMAVVMANGYAKNTPIALGSPEYTRFQRALEYVLIKLAKMIARDGEGATKLVEIVVNGARTEDEAVQAARAVANSNLVKTAIHGADANWGRILCAVGYSGIDFDPANVSISFGDIPILLPNYTIVLDEEKAKEVLCKDHIIITIDLHQGNKSATFYTCDLSKEYIHINASYRS
ncbi:MAG: bifunctional glutamate N-acetyltransferase/amino-acid acetyltransferase ArgJ [Bacteroidetes bacterium]|nr:bifunctional glutamate N-acetyltransferase/amino-acid acetyltransferase ArgJ [Bacteroidota bacterium]